MRKVAPFLLAGGVLSLAFAPAPLPKPDPSKEDLERMQGAWLRISATQGGVVRPLNDVVEIVGRDEREHAQDSNRGDRHRRPPQALEFGSDRLSRFRREGNRRA